MEKGTNGDALKLARCAMGNSANFPMRILEEGEALETSE